MIIAAIIFGCYAYGLKTLAVSQLALYLPFVSPPSGLLIKIKQMYYPALLHKENQIY